MKNKTPPDLPHADIALPEAAAATALPAPASAEAPAAAPAAAVAMSAVGLPIDQYHGRGGTYILHNGVRTLVG